MKLPSLLTYQDTAGHRRLRDYVKATLLILVLVIAASAVGLYNRYHMVAPVMAEPRRLDPALVSTPTEQAVWPVSAPEACPANPADWTLTANTSVPGSNLMGLSPQCTYDRLDKTAAWLYTTYVLGYERSVAASRLGFSQIPVSYSFGLGQITVFTDYGEEPQKVDLRFPSNNSGLAEWRINESGHPAVEFSFGGCFRTSSIVGGEFISWGDGYPIVCQYSGDFETRYYIGNVNGRVFTASGSENVRRILWFGYDSSGSWVFLGIAEDWEYDLSQIHSKGASTINPEVMTERFGIDPRPLPDNWMSFTEQKYAEAFLRELQESN